MPKCNFNTVALLFYCKLESFPETLKNPVSFFLQLLFGYRQSFKYWLFSSLVLIDNTKKHGNDLSIDCLVFSIDR